MTMVILTFVVLGLFSLSRLGIDTFPKIDIPYVIVTTIYPGAGPEEMETLVSEPIEEEVSAIGGVKHVTSISQEGVSVVMMEFDLKMNIDLVAMDVRDKVGQIRGNLPKDIHEPAIQKFDIGALPIINLAVSSPRSPDETYKIAEDVVKKGLSRVRGIANISLTGGLQREITVFLSRTKLRAYDLTPQQVIGQIAASNLNIPAGHVSRGRQEISIRLQGEFKDLDQLRAVEIPMSEGRRVRLDQIGWVEDNFKEERERATFNGESSVGMELVKRADANTVETAKQVFQEIENIKKELPADVRIDVARENAKFIQDSVDDVYSNIIVGVLLTAFVLFLFLHDLPSTIVAAIAMPTSIIATFILIDFAGFTLNMMSLMGLAISVGILVSNSIVVLENIQRYQKLGHSVYDAASLGTNEIALAVAASTLTNIVVFTPIAFMSGMVGQFFKQFGLTVAFATLFSLLISFTLTPMMASRGVKNAVYIVIGLLTTTVIYWKLGLDSTFLFVLALLLGLLAQSFGWLHSFAQAWNRFFDGLLVDYRKSLVWALRHKGLILATVTLLLVGSLALLPLGFIGAEFFPKSDQGAFSVLIEMPVGTSLDQTDRHVNEIGRRVMNQPFVQSVYTSTGNTEGSHFSSSQGVQLGMVIGRMVDRELRPITTAECIKRLRPQLTDIPGAKITVREADQLGGGGESDIQVEITGRDMGQLNLLADSVLAYMGEVGGLVNISSSWEIGKPELQLRPRREALADRGLSPAAVGTTLRNLIEGEVASKYRDAGDEYDIRVKLDPAELRRAEDVGDVYIKAEDYQVKLSELTEMTNVQGPTSISRKEKQRMVIVSADIAKGSLGHKVSALKLHTNLLKLPSGYAINYGGQAQQMGEGFSELLKALVLAIILTYMLLAAMLESYKHPFTIMLTLPLGLIGVMLSLFLTGNTISIFSLMAMVMLVGIVVNNAILQIDYITTLRGEGRRLEEAILEACPVRLRPIVMSNIAAALGMLPLAMGFGAGGEFRAPMAIVSIGGLISSTAFTLYVIPVIYRMFEKEKK